MRKTIRKGLFETNSSTTHCLVVGSKEEFNKWEKGELKYFRGWSSIGQSSRFITKEEEKKLLEEVSWIDEEDFWTFDKFNDEELESDDGEFLSPSGDEMYWWAKYGPDW